MTRDDQIKMLQAEIGELTRVLDSDGFMSVGSKDQPVVHPALAARRQALALLARLEGAILPEPEVDPLKAFADEWGPAT